MSVSAQGWVLMLVVACGASNPRVATPAPVIAVLDPGAEPRQRLRYEPTLHVPERVETRLKLRIVTAFTNTVLEQGQVSADLPTAKIVGRVEVTSLTGGEALVSYQIDEVSALDDAVDPSLRKPLEAELAGLKGWRGSWRMSPSGRLSAIDAGATNPSRATRIRVSNLLDAMIAASVVFPDGEIGIGATWQVTSQETFSTVTWDRTVTYRLRGLQGSMATVDVDTVMRAAPQALSVEPNRTTKLTSGTSKGTAEFTIPMHGLVSTGTSQGTSETSYAIVSRRLRITSTVQIETFFFIKPLHAAE